MNDRGAVTPVVLAGIVLLAVLAVGVADVGRYFAARSRAAAAADAAALAAAPVTFAPFGADGGPAAEAARFARHNGARLVACRCPIDRSWRPRRVEVTVAVRVRLLGLPDLVVYERGAARFDPAALIAPPSVQPG
ncbi:MAG TPA: hypothetical protein ENK55_02380 [Actinobacteria bacterium]|nr:hypothetical protein [Actinomycetota bacterium]